ncbi:MAG: hypothetical protein KBT04_05855 [Bacteroidales bacterium]|nr:hypothetical protein [Candidatus Colimorpha onthohippi]
MFIPWDNIVRLVTPPRFRNGSLLMALIDVFLRHNRSQALMAEDYFNRTVSLYSNIAQPMVVERLLNARYFDDPLYHQAHGNGCGIWIEDGSMANILLTERPNGTPNHLYRQIAGSNLQDGSTQGGNTIGAHRCMAYSVAHSNASRSTSQVIHYQVHPDHPIDEQEMRAYLRRIIFYGLDLVFHPE